MNHIEMRPIPLTLWWQAIRPKTLLASIGPVLLGLSVAYYKGFSISPTIAFTTILCALLLQVGTNLTNDYYDCINGTDGDDRLGPTRLTQAGLISASAMKKSFQFCYLAAVLLGSYLMYCGGLPIILIGISSVFTAWAYTGGPFPLSYFALGEILALVFFGPIAVWGTYFLQTNEFSSFPLIIGLGPGLIAAALMAVNNLRDRRTDEKTRKLTLAIVVGEKGARLVALMPLIISSFLPFYFSYSLDNYWFLFTSLSFYLFLPSWLYLAKGKINSTLNSVLAVTGKYLFLYCLILSITFVVCK